MMEEKRKKGQEEDVIDIVLLLHDFFRGLKKFWWIVVALIIAGAVAAYVRSVSNYCPMYQSKASFTVTTGSSGDVNYGYWFYYDKATATQMVDTFPYILESELLTDLVKQDLGVSVINGSISASAVESSNLFTLAVRSNNPEDAKTILESVIENYPLVSQYVMGDTQLNMIEAPQLPTQPYNSKNHFRPAAKGAALGAVLGLILIGLYALMRKTIRKEDEIKDILNVSCIGVIPRVEFKRRSTKINQEISIHNEKTGEFFPESIRSIALRVSRQMQESNEKIIMVTGTLPEEGITSVAKNLAYALSEMDKKVVYIDAGRKDKKKPERGKHDFLQLIQGKCTPQEALVWDNENRIWHLDCSRGFREAERVTAAGTARKVIHQLSGVVDYIVIDAQSCMYMSEASLAAQCADTILYVIKQDTAKTRRIMEGIEDLCGYGISMAGCVLNQVQSGISGYGYGKYGKYYGRYYSKYSYHKYGSGGYGYYGSGRLKKNQ